MRCPSVRQSSAIRWLVEFPVPGLDSRYAHLSTRRTHNAGIRARESMRDAKWNGPVLIALPLSALKAALENC
jgi:hypothetical protein